MINIPDTIYKLLISIGIGIMIFFILRNENVDDLYFKKRVELNSQIMKYEYGRTQFDVAVSNIKNSAKVLSKIHNTENILIIDDSSCSIIGDLHSNERDQAYNDTIFKLMNQYLQLKKEFDENQLNLKIKQYEYSEYESQSNIEFKVFYLWFFNALFIIIFGFIGWFLSERRKSLKEDRSNYYSKYCQSCGKSFSPIIARGTDIHSDPSKHFCASCYTNGKFTNDKITLDEMLSQTKIDLLKHGFSYLERKIIISRIRNLKRWSKNQYF